jgi:hypothetical protein
MNSLTSATLSDRFVFAGLVTALSVCCLVTGCGKKSETETAVTSEETIAVAPESPGPAAVSATPASLEVAAVPAVVPEIEEEKIDLTGTNYVVDLQAGETPVVEGWIYEIAASEQAPRQKAEALLGLLPRLESDDQRKVAMVALFQISDADYDLVQPQLMNAALDAKVLEVFMTDALKRKNELKMPTLLDLTRAEEHPLHAQARKLLGTYLGRDYGTNWVRWENGITAWLSKNPG